MAAHLVQALTAKCFLRWLGGVLESPGKNPEGQEDQGEEKELMGALKGLFIIKRALRAT